MVINSLAMIIVNHGLEHLTMVVIIHDIIETFCLFKNPAGMNFKITHSSEYGRSSHASVIPYIINQKITKGGPGSAYAICINYFFKSCSFTILPDNS